MTVPHRVVRENPLSKLGSNHAKLCLDLLLFRFNKKLSAEVILESNIKLKLSKRETSALRTAIKLIRLCPDESIIDTLKHLCSMILSADIPERVIDAVVEILRNRELKDLLRPCRL